MLVLFIFHLADIVLIMVFRVRIRGTHRADVFQLFFLGDEFDLSPLRNSTDIDTAQKVMNSVTRREDIKIIDITWRGEWRRVLNQLDLNLLILIIVYRPNIRMADHFRVDRVFIVGG